MNDLFQLGVSYSRYGISDILIESGKELLTNDKLKEVSYRVRISREGIVNVRELNSYFLFVDLDKTGKKERFHFNEYFEGEFFHWESQTTQNQNHKTIKHIISNTFQLLIFIRIKQKIKSKQQPFIFSGRFSYHTHDKSTNYPVRMDLLSLDYSPNTNSNELKSIYKWRPENSGKSSVNKTSYSKKKKRSTYKKPNKTERKGLVTSRVGQGWYRQEILKRWKMKCSVTGCKVTKILISSHIIPWSKCDEKQRLDVGNGLLLSPNLDSLFDKHMITFNEQGNIIISKYLDFENLKVLGVHKEMKLRRVYSDMKEYLEVHNKQFWENEKLSESE